MQQGSPKVTALRSLRPGWATQSDKEDRKKGEELKRRGTEGRHKEKEKRQEGRALWDNVQYL